MSNEVVAIEYSFGETKVFVNGAQKGILLAEWMNRLLSRLSALETARENVYVSPFSDDKPSSNGQLIHEALNHINAPIQPVRIKPEDMVMVKWKDDDGPVQMQFGNIDFDCGIELEYISPIQPVKREWMVFQDDEVWYYPRFGGRMGQIRKISKHSLVQGDLWQPVLSPDEPAPEGPDEGRK